MDKELLRVVIILLGMLAMVGMVLWHFFKSLRENRESDDYFEDSEYDALGDDLAVDEDQDEMDIFPLRDFGDENLFEETLSPPPTEAEPPQPVVSDKPKSRLPALIEFSIVARADEGFNGEDLFEAFERVGLVYGSVKVFERIDHNRLVDFAVASMIEPGTFPDSHLEQFYCPGIVFYMQPREVDNALMVFDDFIETIDILAMELDGVVWDNQRQPLTADTIDHFRQLLAQA